MLNMRAAWIIPLVFQVSCFALDIIPITPNNFTQLEILTSNPNAIGLQSALNSEYRSTNGAITVFPDACVLDDGTTNCTAACQDSRTMFSNLKTLHNCVAFPEISVHLANNNLTAGARGLAEGLNIKPSNNDPSLPPKIFNTIQNCLLASCNNNANCHGKLNHTSNDTYLPLCGSVSHYVDADVGGIGVYISYAMQMGLALIAFLLTIPWLSMIKRVGTSFVNFFRVLSPQRESSKAKQHHLPSSAQSNGKYPEALTSAIVNFQKAQCFFMLATNIASLIAEKSGGLEPETLQQLYNTYVFIKVIAIGGYLPITFTLLNLHMIEQLSWYLLTQSIITVAVATTALKCGNSSFMPTSEDFDQIVSAASLPGPPSCGNQNLVPWCYFPRQNGNYFGFNSSSSGSGADDILIFCLVTLAIIVVDHFCRSDDPNQRSLNRRILTKLGIAPSKPLFPHAGTVLRFGTTAFHFIFFWLYVYCFYIFGIDLDWFRTSEIYDPTWSFGQIVAILVWAPTLCDYSLDQILGVPKGSEHKIPKMYEVVKKVQRAQQGGNSNQSGVTEKELPFSNLEDGRD